MEERITGNNKYKLSKLRWQMNKQYWQPHFLLFSILSFPCSQHCLPYLSSPSFPPTPLEFLSQSSLSSPPPSSLIDLSLSAFFILSFDQDILNYLLPTSSIPSFNRSSIFQIKPPRPLQLSTLFNGHLIVSL